MDEGANAHTPEPYLDDGEHRSVQPGAAHRPQSLATLQTLDVQESRWLQVSADSVAWAAHGMPESPHVMPRPGR
jgi:hypothetical protein